MKKSKLIPSIHDAFEAGKLVGAVEAYEEVLELMDALPKDSLKRYLKKLIIRYPQIANKHGLTPPKDEK